MRATAPVTSPHPAVTPPPPPDPDDTSHQGSGPLREGGVELFPINFTTYQHHEDLDTERYVREIADLLAPYGAHTTEWKVRAAERDSQAVEERLAAWVGETDPPGGNTVLYWVGHGSADILAHHRTPARFPRGIDPPEIARAIAIRQLHPDSEDSWAIIVLDACFSQEFARAVHLELFTKHRGAGRYLLLSTAAQGYAELGALTHALKRALHITFPTQRTIGLGALGRQLNRDLGGFVDDLTLDDDRDQLVSRTANAASAVSGPLDQIAELQAVIDQLPTDEQRHFLPKASGAELGELAWYFHGRTLQRDQILRWLATATHGTLVVTGPAGSGKSALLGHVLLHTSTRLRDILIRHGHLMPLPPGTLCPEDPFDLTVHLAGLTPARTLHLIAQAAGLPDLAQRAAEGRPPADLHTRILAALRERDEPLTLLFDAFDEADQPLVIANQILRPLAALPQVRIVIGTRRSTLEGPDQPAPRDSDLLDALHSRPAETSSGQAPRPRYVEVTQDREALAGYLHAKLHAATRRGALQADDAAIADAVYRLVADHTSSGAEPQQFLYARLAAHEILADPTLLADPTPLIGRTHRQLFTHALQRLHRTDPHYTPLLRALGLAQGRGLPDQDGIWATTADVLTPDGAGGTRACIAGLVRDAAPYLALDHESGQSVYRLAHRTFTEHFTSDPGTPAAHAAITRALTAHARHSLETRASEDGAAPRTEDVNPYTRHHLAIHARLSRAAEVFRALADHPDVLDALDLITITTNALHPDLAPNALPPAIAGTVLLQHQAHDTGHHPAQADTLAWRRWWRRLGTTYIQGTPPPPETHTPQTWPPSLTAGIVHRRQAHLQLIGHTALVWAVAAFPAPDGTIRLATTGFDETVRIWDPATGLQDGEPLTGHTGPVRAVAAFTAPDGTIRLATTGDDQTVRIWNPATGAQDREPLTAHTGVGWAVVAFPATDGTVRLATIGADETVRIWNPATGAQDGEPLTGHTREVRVLAAFTAPDGTPRLASAGGAGTVRIWDPATGLQDGEPLTRHTDWVSSVAAFTASDGTPRLASAGYDAMVRIWDPAAGTHDGEPLTGHTGPVYAVAAFTAPDGTPRLASTGDDGTVRIWNPATSDPNGEPLTGEFTAQRQPPMSLDQMAEQHARRVKVVAAFTAPDRTPRLVITGDDGTMRTWDPATETQDGPILIGPTGRPNWEHAGAVFTAPDGTPRLASTGDDKMVRIWDPATGAQDGDPLTGHTRKVWAVAAFTAPDGTPRLASASYDETVRIWNPATGAQDGPTLTAPRESPWGLAAFTALDGTPRLASPYDSDVRIWNPATGAHEVPYLTGHTGKVNTVTAFTAPDGTSRIASASEDETVRIWNPASGTAKTLPLADRALVLTEHRGLLIVGTASGYLALDISSVSADTT
ncbi:WD40 repeat domain-containing protein [Streptomyces sp. NPDC048606]|uniref:WD40 repeat domain-containing protein n=1 Tax=Streptomyces sp. NPDC048606 TaxID=3154726 RepID=UPI00342F6310